MARVILPKYILFALIFSWVSLNAQTVLEIKVRINNKAADKAVVMFGSAGSLSSYNSGNEGKVEIPVAEEGVFHIKVRKASFRTSWYELDLSGSSDLPPKLQIETELIPRLEGISQDDPVAPEIFLEYAGGQITENSTDPEHKNATEQLSGIKSLAGQRLDQYKAKEKHFRQAAQKSFGEGSIIDAREAYTRASQAYPEPLRKYYTDQAYYTDALAKCEDILSEKKEENENYELAISTADDFFRRGDLDNAEKVYKQALQFRPNASYPKEQITKVREKRKSYEANRMLYNILIESAEKWERQEKYEKAASDYEQALALIPTETHIQDKIATLKEKAEERDREYENLIIIADRLKNGRNYEEALATYRRAKSLKPEEGYPATQISEITSIFQGRNNADAEYDLLISKADKHFEKAEWKLAADGYERALQAKSGDEYAKQRRTESLRLAREAKENREEFNDLLARGDEEMDVGDAEAAIESYQLALNIFPGDPTATDKLAQAEALFAMQKKRSAQLKELISSTRSALENRNGPAARTAVDEAIQIAPQDREVLRLAEDVSQLEGEIRANEKAYAGAISRAEQAELSGRLTSALGYYREALELRPDDERSTRKIAEMESLIAKQTKDEQVQQLMGQGNQELENGNPQKALDYYEQALAVDNANAEIITAINNAKAEINRIAELRAETDELISEGDKAFENADYPLAISSWEEAYARIPEKSTQEKITKAREEQAIIEDSRAALEAALDDADKAIRSSLPESAEDALQRARTVVEKAGIEDKGILALQERLDKLKADIARDKAYNSALMEGNNAMEQGNAQAAIQAYLKAQRQKDGDEVRSKLAEAYALQSELEDKEARFTRSLERGREALAAENWESAISAFTQALSIKENHEESIEGLERAKREARIAAEQANAFRVSYARADEAFQARELENARRAIEEAVSIFPDNQEALALQNTIISMINARAAEEKAYAAYILKGDSLKQLSELEAALSAFESALEIKPGAEYPQAEAESIRLRISEMEQKEERYDELISDAERFAANDELPDAIRSFEAAAVIKPAEDYPRDEAKRLSIIYEEKRRKLKEEYDRIVAEADDAWQKKIIDQAMSKYREARDILPEEEYAPKMIDEINNYLEEHLVVELNREEKSISERKEMKFTFDPLEPIQRRSTYILLTAENPSPDPLKIYLNYGKGSTKNGGIVFKAQPNEGEYIIRVSSQYRWYDQPNDWIGIYPEGGDFKVSVIQMATGD